MAAAKRARSRVCGSRLSCFAVILSASPSRVGTKRALAFTRKRAALPAATSAQYSAGGAVLPSCADAEARLPFRPMLSNMRAFVGAALVSVAAAPSLIAQASPYLTLDDPRLPLLEHLIARGDVEDPS